MAYLAWLTGSVIAKAWLLAALLAVATLACGGGDDGGGDVPLPDGAEQLDSAEASEDELSDLGFEAEDAEGLVYRTDASLDEVTAYYSGDVEDDDWTVEQAVTDTPQPVAILSKDDDIATILLMDGATAKAGQGLFEGEDLDIDWDEVADDDTVILISRLTCGEDSVDDCLAALLSE
jgi:hypothetical protein